MRYGAPQVSFGDPDIGCQPTGFIIDIAAPRIARGFTDLRDGADCYMRIGRGIKVQDPSVGATSLGQHLVASMGFFPPSNIFPLAA
jgi:hypothetical protein